MGLVSRSNGLQQLNQSRTAARRLVWAVHSGTHGWCTSPMTATHTTTIRIRRRLRGSSQQALCSDADKLKSLKAWLVVDSSRCAVFLIHLQSVCTFIGICIYPIIIVGAR